ncbi:hypothetical protein DVH05_006686 [Phytophthora capsici]|nr:hypothetical protein DVH05_006686 [Phytophthora capsici]
MMQYVRSDPSRYNVTVEKVKQFERLLVCLDQTIKCFRAVSSKSSRCFVTGMLQKTGKKKTGVTATEVADVQVAAGVESMIGIRTNRVFLEEIVHCIRARLSIAEGAITSATETFERNDLIGTAGLCVLLCRLLPSNVPADPALYKRLWEMQTKAPCVTLSGTIMWHMPAFLLKYSPMTSKKLKPD